MEYNLQEYKGVWWQYDAPSDRWVLSNSESYWESNLMLFKGEYLITDCFELFALELIKNCV